MNCTQQNAVLIFVIIYLAVFHTSLLKSNDSYTNYDPCSDSYRSNTIQGIGVGTILGVIAGMFVLIFNCG